MSERTKPRPKFIKKSISYPFELMPFVTMRVANNPRFRKHFSTYLTFLIAEDKDRYDRQHQKVA